jgi:iron(III) transport system substrate-binding protein
MNLAEEGLLQAYDSPAAADVPAQFKDPEHRWTGVAVRARMLVTYRGGNSPRKALRKLDDLLDPSLKNQITLARPTAGTTGGHVAALFVLWGGEKASAYFRSLHANGVKLVGGNSIVAETVGKGVCTAGITDNDDVFSATKEGAELHATLPDQDTFGTLAVPTTVGLVAGRPQSESAKKLVDYLISKEVEKKLLDAQFAYAPVRGTGTTSAKWMQIDYREVARAMPQAVRKATSILEGRE